MIQLSFLQFRAKLKWNENRKKLLQTVFSSLFPQRLQTMKFSGFKIIMFFHLECYRMSNHLSHAILKMRLSQIELVFILFTNIQSSWIHNENPSPEIDIWTESSISQLANRLTKDHWNISCTSVTNAVMLVLVVVI